MNILSISSSHSSSKSWSNSTFLVFREGSELVFTYSFATWDLKQPETLEHFFIFGPGEFVLPVLGKDKNSYPFI